MKILNAFLTLLCLLFAYFQLNDPDPLLWVFIYLLVALMTGLAFFGRYYKLGLWGGIAFCIGKLLFLLPDFIHWIRKGAPSIVEEMKTEAPHIELTREFLGIFICIGILYFVYWQGQKVKK